MPPLQRLRAVFDRVEPVHEPGGQGLELGFRPLRTPAHAERVDDYAHLGPAVSVVAVEGVGKVVRLLRAARLAVPREPLDLLGRADDTAARLEKALGCNVRLEVRPRSRIRFTAWTESGVETVDDVAEVVEGESAYLVTRRNGGFPVRIEREAVVRRQTECERWLEIVGVERA